MTRNNDEAEFDGYHVAFTYMVSHDFLIVMNNEMMSAQSYISII